MLNSIDIINAVTMNNIFIRLHFQFVTVDILDDLNASRGFREILLWSCIRSITPEFHPLFFLEFLGKCIQQRKTVKFRSGNIVQLNGYLVRVLDKLALLPVIIRLYFSRCNRLTQSSQFGTF